MNKKDALEFLIAALGGFLRHPLLLQEIAAIIAGTGYELGFYNLLIKRLAMLSRMGALATQHEEFESLGNGLFSMHLAAKKFNIRILYSFMPNRQPVLLLAFYERGGKRKTNYEPHLTPAQQRLAQLRKEHENEK